MVGALLGHNLGHQPVLRPNTSEESAHGMKFWMKYEFPIKEKNISFLKIIVIYISF